MYNQMDLSSNLNTRTAKILEDHKINPEEVILIQKFPKQKQKNTTIH